MVSVVVDLGSHKFQREIKRYIAGRNDKFVTCFYGKGDAAARIAGILKKAL